MANNLVVKKRRPINKREAKRIKQGLLDTHGLDLPISAGNYEQAFSANFDVVIQHGYITALVFDDQIYLSVRGLLSNVRPTGWVQGDMGVVKFVCTGSNVIAAGFGRASCMERV